MVYEFFTYMLCITNNQVLGRTNNEEILVRVWIRKIA